ncbi:MAG: ribonuclease R, partial [Kiritimatiellae bacterium]|nr:ribonuclease R [Kiritimatiellia bacterium]
MDINKLRQDIFALLQTRANVPMTAQEISKALKLHGHAGKKIQKWLNQLVVNGQIVRIRDNKYSVGEPADLVTGKIDIARSGTGFLTETGGPDIVISATELNTALPGDRVVVRLDAQSKDKRRSGSVIRILERSRHDIVGTLKSTGRFYYVVPIDASYSQDFYVPDAKGGRIG